jgi:dTDP-4-amino-4,6-dideoxygalactose transaminase
LGNEEAEAVKKVLESGWLIQGKKVQEFEGMVSQYTGAKYAKACSSCTTALHMALLALGIGKGDKVIIPAYTFVATANAVEYTGAKPVFADIDLRTFNIDYHQMLKALFSGKGNRVKALMPVHLFGLCADMEAILGTASKYKLRVIEDAACALGSTCPKGKAGAMSDAGCFSFHPRKSVTTGEGGMLTTDNEEIARTVGSLRDFGFSITNLERHDKGITTLSGVNILGYNYRMNDIQSSIGVEQMKKFGWILDNRIKRAEIYNRELAGIGWLRVPYVPVGYKHTYQSYSVLITDSYETKEVEKWHQFRDKLMAKLNVDGVATRQGTHAVHMLGYYAKKYHFKPEDFPNTYAADQLSMTIPLFPHMSDAEQEYVIEKIKEFRG